MQNYIKQKMILKKTIYMPVIFLLIFNLHCTQTPTAKIQNGDILFCSYESGELSGAIDEVTQTGKKTNYSHMGIVEIADKDTFVIHASSKKNVVKERLRDFIETENASIIDIYRVKEKFRPSIESALELANNRVGLPYNFSYRMSDSSFYCSQLVYQIFESDSLFKLNPMTFKSPDKEEFHPDWIKYYEKLGIEIPEGEPGCNPNGMAASANIKKIMTLLK